MSIDLLVIGGGAAGLAAARSAVRRGAAVTLVQDGPVGGDCTFTGCVPSKTLIEAVAAGASYAEAMARVRDTVTRIAATESADVLRGEGVHVVEGRARFTGRRTVRAGGAELSARRIVVASGSRPALPPVDGLAAAALTSDTVWSLEVAPASLVVLGGGAIGCELAQAFARAGISVTLVEQAERLLVREEPRASDVIAAALVADGVRVRTGVGLSRIGGTAGDWQLTLDDGSTVQADAVLVATGRSPDTATLDLAAAGVDVDDRGYVRTDQTLATSTPGIYAAGDVTGRLPFTHAADEMGRIAASNALRGRLRPARRWDPDPVPWVTFTDPEVARVGMTREQAAEAGGRAAYLPLTSVDRAVTAGRTEGFIQLLAGPRRLTRNLGGGRLLGATIVAPRAGELIHEVALLMRMGAFTGRLAQTVHAYPTWALGLRSAAAQFFAGTGEPQAVPAGDPPPAG